MTACCRMHIVGGPVHGGSRSTRPFLARVVSAAVVALALCSFDAANATEVNQAATMYLRGLAEAAVRNASPTPVRVAFWKKMFEEQFNFDHVISLAAGPAFRTMSDANKQAARHWAVAYSMHPEGPFMEMVKQSVINGFDLGSCEGGGVTCQARIRFTRQFDSELKFTIVVERRGEGYKVSDIVFNENMRVRVPLANALKQAMRSGLLQLAAR